MRSIKFRAWDKIHNEMNDNEDLIFRDQENTCVYTALSDEEWINENNWVPMQYTGLKDSTGSEIYEGDIVQLVNEIGEEIRVLCKFGNVIREVVCSNGETEEVEITGFYFENEYGNKTFPIVKNYMGVHDLKLFEVVGNIYENPELLGRLG